MVQNSIYYLICLNNHFWHFQIGYIWCNILVTLVVHELHLEADLILMRKYGNLVEPRLSSAALTSVSHTLACSYVMAAILYQLAILLKKKLQQQQTTKCKWVVQLASQLKKSLRKKQKKIVHTWRCPTWCSHGKGGTHSYTTCCGWSTGGCSCWGIFFNKIHDPKQSHEIEQRILNLQILNFYRKIYWFYLLKTNFRVRIKIEKKMLKKHNFKINSLFFVNKKSDFVDSGFVVRCHEVITSQ